MNGSMVPEATIGEQARTVEGTGETTPREYSNEITAFIDASMVYGSDEATSDAHSCSRLRF